VLTESPLELLRRANPASVEKAGELAVAINLDERVRSAIADETSSPTTRPSWSRAIQIPSRTRKHRVRLVIVLVLLLAALVSVPLVGARILDLFSASGTPVQKSEFGAQDQWLLEHLGAGSGEKRIEKIASDGRLTFYVIHGHEGRICLASGPNEVRPVIGRSACGAVSDLRKELPTREHPLYAETGSKLNPSTREFTIERIVGLAATGIVRVELRAGDGHVIASAPVSGHVFELLRLAVAPPVTLRAIGEEGDRLYERRIP
jgi:hypothetical protein